MTTKTKELARRKSPQAKKLPKLQVGIYEGCKLVRVVDVPDPRERFCQAWNEFEPDGPHVAKPLASKAGKAVRT